MAVYAEQTLAEFLAPGVVPEDLPGLSPLSSKCATFFIILKSFPLTT